MSPYFTNHPIQAKISTKASEGATGGLVALIGGLRVAPSGSLLKAREALMRNGISRSIDKIVENTPHLDQIELANRIMMLFHLLSEVSTENIYLKEKITILQNQIHSLERIIEPDDGDVYNINRRIDILAQRVATLESESKKRWWER
jgi:hypothetical protein